MFIWWRWDNVSTTWAALCQNRPTYGLFLSSAAGFWLMRMYCNAEGGNSKLYTKGLLIGEEMKRFGTLQIHSWVLFSQQHQLKSSFIIQSVTTGLSESPNGHFGVRLDIKRNKKNYKFTKVFVPFCFSQLTLHTYRQVFFLCMTNSGFLRETGNL